MNGRKEFRTASTVGHLRAALAELPKNLPAVVDGVGLLDLVQRDDERADGVRRGECVEADADDMRLVSVVWLLDEDRD